jgi:protein SCO1
MRHKLLSRMAFLLLSYGAAASETHPARGLVVKVDAAHQSLLISCEKIPDYMDAMLMEFQVKNPKEMDALRPGAMIEFTLVVDDKASYIRDIHVHHYESVEQDPLTARRLSLITALANGSSPAPTLKVGDHVPDFTLMDQNRQNVSLSQFTGKIVLITFTYTHCALPNFCFRIANHFRLLQNRFAAQMGHDLEFLTITFDPLHDTPEVMAKYGKTWNADPNNWRLLTGSPSDIQTLCGKFGVSFWSDEGLMNHSLHTFVIDRDGSLVTDLEGNEYSTDQLGDLVQSLLSRSSNRATHTEASR